MFVRHRDVLQLQLCSAEDHVKKLEHSTPYSWSGDHTYAARSKLWDLDPVTFNRRSTRTARLELSSPLPVQS